MNSTVSQSESEVSSMAWIPHPEDLQRYLAKGEYPLFQSVAMFESNFIQITRGGRHVDVHNHPTEATIGIVSTDNKLPLPNIMLIARPVPTQNGQVSSGGRAEQLVLTRLLPLKFVRISVHDPDRQRIKLQLANGRSYYLQLYASPEEQEPLFDRWLSLIYLLHHPPSYYLRPTSCTSRDSLSVRILASEEEIEAGTGSQSKEWEDEEPEEEEKGPVDHAARPLGESSSPASVAKEPSTETKQELNSESKECGSLVLADVVRNDGDLRERVECSSLHVSAALVQTRENTSVCDRADTPAKGTSTSSSTSVKGRCSSLKIVTLFSTISKILLRKSSEEETINADHG
nr:protein FAM71C-like [Pelodiscus sinensis]XP_025037292.1 protein FAM71C-like [Pelodiscus sinensis]|eukprot:XP_025037291.1 protein FAM71C-like [Pelodiscus sinensis]